MKGFFDKKETQSVTRPDGKSYSCASCRMLKNSAHPRMRPAGNFRKHILIINNYPSLTDDRIGKPLQGKAGAYLARELAKHGIDLWEDCLVTNAVLCVPFAGNEDEVKPVNKYVLACCRKSLLQLVHETMPKVIITLGEAGLHSLLHHRWHKDFGVFSKWRGWTIPDQDMKAWLCPVEHPAWILRGDREHKTIFEQDIARAAERLRVPFPAKPKAKIEIIEDLRVLYDIPTGSQTAFDYETTGLKPHAPGHRIVCASIAVSPSHAYAFMMPDTLKERKPFIDYLTNVGVRKIAQNMKFEHAWSLVRLRTEVRGWEWDTMLASHIMDNRPGVTGLKFQTYVQFGIVDYDSDVAPFLKSAEEGNANALNRIMELVATPGGKQKLLEYCGWDSIFEYRLAHLQTEALNYTFLPF